MSKSSAVPECRHILTSGRKCRAIALRGKPFCFQHSRQRTLAADLPYKSVKLPPLEDHASILLALTQVMRAMTANRLDSKAAGRCLYAIQLAMQTIRLIEAQPPVEQVTDFLPGRFGDTIAVNDEPRTPEDMYYLLSEHERSHSSYGDNGWEPTNADYEPESNEPEITPSEITQPKGDQRENQAALGPAAVSLQPADRPNALSAVEPTPPPIESDARVSADTPASPLASPGAATSPSCDSRPEGTVDNSPGRKSRGRVADSNSSEVPEGRPNHALAAGPQSTFHEPPPDPTNAKTIHRPHPIH
jgi:hypothetical protein